MGPLPIHHGLRDLTVLDRRVFVHLYLPRPASEEVLDGSNIARGDRGCLGVKCVANKEGEPGLGLWWFRSHHAQCPVWNMSYRDGKTGRTRRLYRARTSFCSPDFPGNMTLMWSQQSLLGYLGS